jgi:hypothetical protein
MNRLSDYQQPGRHQYAGARYLETMASITLIAPFKRLGLVTGGTWLSSWIPKDPSQRS